MPYVPKIWIDGEYFDGTAATRIEQAIADATATAEAAQPAGDYATSTDLSSGLADKANVIHAHVSTDISDATTVGRSVLTAVDAATVRAAIGAGTSNLVLGTTAGTAREGSWIPTKTDVGLGSVDNTSDMAKPVSTATQAALDAKQGTGDYATNTALTDGLAGKSDSTHTHEISGVNGLQPMLDKAPGNTVMIWGSGARVNPADGSPLPFSAHVIWVASTVPAEFVTDVDILFNIGA